MAKDICAICGETPGLLKSVTIVIGKTTQVVCSDCAKEVQGMGEVALCRHALSRCYAKSRDKIQARLDFITAAEEARPKCMRCNTPLKFSAKVTLDASPMRDSIFSSTFDLIPAHCPSCFKMELFSPEMLQQSEWMLCLYTQDT